MIRKAVHEDFSFFFSVKCEEENLYWCGYRDKPVKDNLQMFWNRYVPADGKNEDNPDGSVREIYMVQEVGHPVGYLYIDYLPDKAAELSIGISMAESGKGYGTKAVKEAVKILSAAERSVIAYIREDNDKSQKLFSGAGLHQTQEYREMILPCGKVDKKVRLYKWEADRMR